MALTCCYPYDIRTALIAEELGVIVTAPDGDAGCAADVAHDVGRVDMLTR